MRGRDNFLGCVDVEIYVTAQRATRVAKRHIGVSLWEHCMVAASSRSYKDAFDAVLGLDARRSMKIDWD
jgi:hypothetical protein